ncbi:unnamed protein product [Prorocentrum cordatum]|uniref:Uncharacterized protein n=2 Tax=Prorocentrum cordatum TaxID=2364126 RepID=A0ABN9XYJ9_9DINO|nr:unnamed protein product [Polarella glacialis]
MLQAEACRRRRRSETQGRKEHTGGGSRMVLAKTTKSAARMLTLICSLRMCHQATSDDPVSTGIREDTAKRLNQTVALDYAFSSKRDGTSLSKFVQHDRRCLAQKSLRLRTMQEPLAGCHACAEARTSDDLSLSMRGHGDRDPFPGASFSPKGPDSGPPRPQNRGRIRSPGIRGSPMWSTPAPRSRSTSYIYIHSSLPRARGRGQPCLWEDLSRAAGAARPRCQRWALPPSPLARQAPDSGVRRRGAWAGGGSQEAAYGKVVYAQLGGAGNLRAASSQHPLEGMRARTRPARQNLNSSARARLQGAGVSTSIRDPLGGVLLAHSPSVGRPACKPGKLYKPYELATGRHWKGGGKREEDSDRSFKFPWASNNSTTCVKCSKWCPCGRCHWARRVLETCVCQTASVRHPSPFPLRRRPRLSPARLCTTRPVAPPRGPRPPPCVRQRRAGRRVPDCQPGAGAPCGKGLDGLQRQERSGPPVREGNAAQVSAAYAQLELSTSVAAYSARAGGAAARHPCNLQRQAATRRSHESPF